MWVLGRHHRKISPGNDRSSCDDQVFGHADTTHNAKYRLARRSRRSCASSGLRRSGVAMTFVALDRSRQSRNWARLRRSGEIVGTTLVDAVFVEHLEERMIVAIVHMDSDDYRPLRVKGLLHDRSDIVRLVDHETRRSERLGIPDVVDWTEVGSRTAAVFQFLLRGYHIVSPIDPDHVNDVRLEANRRLQFHGGI